MYLKTQRFIAETHTEGHRKTHTERQRKTHTHRHTQRETHTHRDKYKELPQRFREGFKKMTTNLGNWLAQPKVGSR